MLFSAMCSKAQRENYYSEFEARMLRPGEDPAFYKWDLEQKLFKADPLLDASQHDRLCTTVSSSSRTSYSQR